MSSGTWLLELAVQELLETVDGAQGVLVDRVDVVAVVLRHAAQVGELRQIRVEHVELVHLVQGAVDAVREAEHIEEGACRGGCAPHRVVDQRRAGADEAARGGAEAHAMALRVGEHPQQQRRVGPEGRRVADHQLAAGDAHAGTNGASAEPSDDPWRRALRAAGDDIVGEAIHRPSVQIVVAHEPLDVAAVPVVAITELGRDALLVLEGELVEVLAAQEVQRVAHAPEKVARRRDLACTRAR